MVGLWKWNKQQEGSYDNNIKKINTWNYYYEEDGKIKECFSDNGFNKAYYNNGQIYFSVEIKDGKKVGEYKRIS